MTMTDGTSSASAVESALSAANAEPDSGPSAEPNPPTQQSQEPASQPVQQQSGVNPAWEPLRSKLGEVTFRLVQDDLKEMDRLAQQRITEANAEREKFTALGDFDTVQGAMSLIANIDEDPKAFYERMGDLLRQQGLLEEAAAADAAADAVDDDAEDDDPVVQRLHALEEREQQRVLQAEAARFERELDTKVESITKANPWMSQVDKDEIMSRAGKYLTPTATVDQILEKASAEWIGVRQSLQSVPRAGDSAPRLVPSGGGNPAAAAPQDPAKMSVKDTRSLIENVLKAANQ